MEYIQIRQEIEQMVSPEGYRGVSDGIINPIEYEKARYKILWVLYEPYGDTGGWSLTDAMNRYASWDEIRNSHKFHRQLIYTVYGILNGFVHREEMPNIRNQEVFQVLKQFAYINVKKIPNHIARMVFKDVKSSAKTNMPLLLKQIKVYSPDIVILGGTMKFFRHSLSLNAIPNGSVGSVNYYLADRLYLETYHPSNTILSEERFCNEIIDAVKSSKI